MITFKRLQNEAMFKDMAMKDYYWYLRSPPFRKAFLEHLGATASALGDNVLDVACGEGQLAEHVAVNYTGFDASSYAIERASFTYPHAKFYVARIEEFDDRMRHDVIVFGGVFHVLVEPKSHIALLERYLMFFPKFFIIYDLEGLPTTEIGKRFSLIDEYHASAKIDGIEEIKKHRKILVYRCSKP